MTRYRHGEGDCNGNSTDAFGNTFANIDTNTDAWDSSVIHIRHYPLLFEPTAQCEGQRDWYCDGLKIVRRLR